MMLMAAYASIAGGIGTPVGTPPNLIGLAIIEKFAGCKSPSSSGWFRRAHVMMQYVLLFVLLYFLHKPEMTHIAGSREYVGQERARLGPWKTGQKNALFAFLVTVCLWVIPGIPGHAMAPPPPPSKPTTNTSRKGRPPSSGPRCFSCCR